MKKMMVLLAVLFVFTAAFSQADLRERSMMKTPIFYASANGEIGTAEYWQLQLGNFPVRVGRSFPGLGVVQMEGNVNIAFMSGGYLEGNGFAGAPNNPQVRSQRISTEANFAVKRNGRYESIRPDTIDYIFWGGTMVQIKGESAPEDLYVFIEDAYNTDHAKNFNLAVFVHDKRLGELVRSFDRDPVAISFTREGARRGHQANTAEANR